MSRPEDDMKAGMVTMCYVSQMIYERVARLNLTAKKIAEKMTIYSGKLVSESSVGHYNDATNTGVPKEKIGAWLDAHELRVVPKENICVPPARYASLIHLANERMAQLAAEEEGK